MKEQRHCRKGFLSRTAKQLHWSWNCTANLFLDVLRIVLHNAEEMLLDVFKRCYSDPRDIWKVLREIATQDGTVTEYRDRIVVELTALPIPAHRRATENLFYELNADRHTMESNNKTIYFKIKNSPS